MKHWGVKQKVMMLGILPASVIAIMLSFIFISIQYNNLEQSLEQRGKLISAQLAQSAEYGVFSANTQILSSLIQNVREATSVDYILVRDPLSILAHNLLFNL